MSHLHLGTELHWALRAGDVIWVISIERIFKSMNIYELPSRLTGRWVKTKPRRNLYVRARKRKSRNQKWRSRRKHRWRSFVYSVREVTGELNGKRHPLELGRNGGEWKSKDRPSPLGDDSVGWWTAYRTNMSTWVSIARSPVEARSGLMPWEPQHYDTGGSLKPTSF